MDVTRGPFTGFGGSFTVTRQMRRIEFFGRSAARDPAARPRPRYSFGNAANHLLAHQLINRGKFGQAIRRRSTPAGFVDASQM